MRKVLALLLLVLLLAACGSSGTAPRDGGSPPPQPPPPQNYRLNGTWIGYLAAYGEPIAALFLDVNTNPSGEITGSAEMVTIIGDYLPATVSGRTVGNSLTLDLSDWSATIRMRGECAAQLCSGAWSMGSDATGTFEIAYDGSSDNLITGNVEPCEEGHTDKGGFKVCQL